MEEYQNDYNEVFGNTDYIRTEKRYPEIKDTAPALKSPEKGRTCGWKKN